jgi:adenylyltransferase/sulfurtransferase
LGIYSLYGLTPVVSKRNIYEKQDLVLPDSLPVSLNNIVFLKDKLNTNSDTIFVCKYGYKSIYAIRLLKEAGYKGKMYSLKGGTEKY